MTSAENAAKTRTMTENNRICQGQRCRVHYYQANQAAIEILMQRFLKLVQMLPRGKMTIQVRREVVIPLAFVC